MATLSQDINNILNIAKRGARATSDTLREEQVHLWIRTYRPMFTEQMHQTRERVPLAFYQRTGCLELESIDLAECPCEDIMWGCEVKRVEIPQPVYIGGRPVIEVALVDGLTTIDLVNPTAVRSARHARFTGKDRRAYLDRSVNEGMVYLYLGTEQDDEIGYIKVRGMFDDPTKVKTYIGSPGNCVERCFDYDDDDYPMTAQVRAMVYRAILMQELQFTAQTLDDILNDNRDDQSAMAIRQALTNMNLYAKRGNPGTERTGAGRNPSVGG